MWRDTFQIPSLKEAGLPWITPVKHWVWFPSPLSFTLFCDEIQESGSSSILLHGTGWLKRHLHSLLLASPEVVPEPTRTPSRASSGARSAETKMQNWPFILGILYEEVRLQKGVLRVLWRCLCDLTSLSWYTGTFLPFFTLYNYFKAHGVLGACVIHWIASVPVTEGISLINQIPFQL